MNYRHAFHAGNFADVFKHAILVRILLYLMRKDAPFRYVETHAGRGLYDLAGSEAARTQEWRSGISRLLDDDIPAAAGALLAPYLELARAFGLAQRYPGSPLLAQRLLRPTDRLLLVEQHPDEARALADATGRDRRVRIMERDGYGVLNASLPPPERRGLVLIDPPFEVADEWARMLDALTQAHRKWPTGVYALWYPVKDPKVADDFAARLVATGIPRLLRLELLRRQETQRGRHDALGLIGCGLAIVNPPFTLPEEASIFLPFLAERLADGGQGAARIEWLADGT